MSISNIKCFNADDLLVLVNFKNGSGVSLKQHQEFEKYLIVLENQLKVETVTGYLLQGIL